MGAHNPHEAEARARKVAALCRAIDGGLRDVYGSLTDEQIAAFLRKQGDAWWRALSRQHGIHQPSSLTQEAVVLEYEARAEEANVEPFARLGGAT